jgi:hypothetical protein
MALPKQGTRRITVDNANYRWGVYGKKPLVAVRIELFDSPGQQLVAKLSNTVRNSLGPGGNQHGVRAVTPELVKRIILIGLARGWQPDHDNLPQFHVDDADALFPVSLSSERKLLRAVVITPFDPAGRRVLDTVNGALREIGVKTYDFRDLPPGASLANAITAAIREADFLVADVTRQSPNILFEVGFAAALAKPTILLVDGTVADKMPSDLAGLSYLTYDPKNFRPLHDYLGRAVRRLTDREGER